jgi:hypothetical protein
MTAPSPEKQVAAFLAKFDPAVAAVARQARTRLRRLLPGTLELVYDNYNALAIGFGPTERASDVICSIAIFPRWVSFFLMHGATLDDPAGVLEGGGRRARHIVLETAAGLDAPAVRALIAQAVARHPRPLDPAMRRRTIVKSISAKQRPRRPTAKPAPRKKAGKKKA